MMRKFFLILLVLFLPGIVQANYTHILFYYKSEKYTLVNAFPIAEPDSCKGMLFSDNDWHFSRYRDGEELHQFLAALGFKDEESRIQFRSIFQTSQPRSDRFTSRNWSNFFNWLSDMRIEDVFGQTILIKELYDVRYGFVKKHYSDGNYFPVIDGLEYYIPKLVIEVNGAQTNVIDFGTVGRRQQKTVQVVLRAEFLNNALLTINPLRRKDLDSSIEVDKANKSIFISEYKADTLTFTFSPLRETSSPYWDADTLTFVTALTADYLANQENLIITGIRDRSLTANIPWQLLIRYGAAGFGLLLILILFRKFIGKMLTLIFTRGLFRLFRFKKKRKSEPHDADEIEEIETAEMTPKPLPNIPYHEDSDLKTTTGISKEEKLFKVLERFYYEYAEFSMYKEAFKTIFGPNLSNKSEIFKIVEKINTGKKSAVDTDNKELQWYRETFRELKEQHNIAELEDVEARVFLAKRNKTDDYKKFYEIISEYCYRPVLNDFHLFLNKTDPVNRNMDIFKKNKDALIKVQEQLRDFESYQREINEFITDVSCGNIVSIKEFIRSEVQNDNGRETDADNVIDFENFIKVKNLFDGVTETFYDFIKEMHKHLQEFENLDISEYWKEIVSQILNGASGLGGINGCLARYDSFNNPDVLFKFLDIHTVMDCKKYSKKKVKNKFRDKFLLQSSCWTVLQNVFRLSIYLDRKEFLEGDDPALQNKIKLLAEELRKLLINFDVYPHQLKLITTSKLQKELAGQLTDSPTSYLELIKPIRTRLKQMVLTKELQKGFIYDVDFVGYDVKLNGSVKYKKAKTSKVRAFNYSERYFD